MATRQGNRNSKKTAGAATVKPAANTGQSGDETKLRILKAAHELFSRQGFTAVTMRQLAKRVDLNQATLYHHFASKEVLYRELLRWAYADRASALIATIRGPGSREQRLYRISVDFCTDLHADLPFVKLIKWEQLQGDRERMRMLLDLLFDEWIVALRELFAEFDSGLDPQLLSTFFTGLVLHYYETTAFRELYEGKGAHRDAKVIGTEIYRIVRGALQVGGSITPPS